MELHPYFFCLSFYLLYFFVPPFEDNGLLFWVPDVLCRHQNLFKCSFDEYVGEKVVSLSYSSAILGPPPYNLIFSTEKFIKSIIHFISVNKYLSFLNAFCLKSMEKAVAPYSSTLPGKSHGWRSLVGYSPLGR